MPNIQKASVGMTRQTKTMIITRYTISPKADMRSTSARTSTIKAVAKAGRRKERTLKRRQRAGKMRVMTKITVTPGLWSQLLQTS